MLSSAILFISNAWAQDMTYGPAFPNDRPSEAIKYVPLGIVVLVIYFLFIHKKK